MNLEILFRSGQVREYIPEYYEDATSVIETYKHIKKEMEYGNNSLIDLRDYNNGAFTTIRIDDISAVGYRKKSLKTEYWFMALFRLTLNGAFCYKRWYNAIINKA